MTAVTAPELRAVPWGPVAGGTGLGAASLAVDRWLVPGGPGSALVWFALAAFATAAAFVLDEPSAAAVDAAPRTRRAQMARRLLVGLLPVTAWLAGTAVAARAEPSLSWPALAVTGGGVLAVTLGTATVLRRTGHAAPGELVAAGAGAAVVIALVSAVPKVGPVLVSGDAPGRVTAWWVVLGAAAAGSFLWGSRDPAG